MNRKTWIHLAAVFALASATVKAQAPVGEVFAGEASVRGSVVLAGGGTSVLGGSQVSAGESAALLKLQRGGELRICPRTSLSVNTSPQGDELMIGFNTGSLELHYTLATGADTVMTPDFRIQMIGPGTFHIAVAADARGSTCVRTLEGDKAGVIVSEVMGSGSYQVTPDSAVTFTGGLVSTAKESTSADCGCLAPKTPALQATATAPPPPVPPPPPIQTKIPPELHLQVDTPMVYQGDSRPPAVTASRISTSRTNEVAAGHQPKGVPPANVAKTDAATAEKTASDNKPNENKGGFFRRIGRFFASPFRSLGL